MDIEVIVHEGALKVLEIDARLPSQTPTVVLHASGMNMAALLAETVLGGHIPVVDRTHQRGCCYQHVRVGGGTASVLGEHMMGTARPLRLIPGLYGADKVITDLPQGSQPQSGRGMGCHADHAGADRRGGALQSPERARATGR